MLKQQAAAGKRTPAALLDLLLTPAPPKTLTPKPTNSNPSATAHFFSIDSTLVYWNFFLDFGPLNLGQLYRFCSTLNSKLQADRHKRKVVYYFSSTHSHRRANAAFLISAWSMLYLNKSAEEGELLRSRAQGRGERIAKKRLTRSKHVYGNVRPCPPPLLPLPVRPPADTLLPCPLLLLSSRRSLQTLRERVPSLSPVPRRQPLRVHV